MPLSYSALSAYRRCPRQYEFACIKKIPQPRTPEHAFGVGIHSCLAKWGKEEMTASSAEASAAKEGRRQMAEGGQFRLFEERISLERTAPLPSAISHLPSSRLLQLWRESFITDGYPTKAAADFDRARGERLLEKFYDWWRKEERNVVAVEKGFRLEKFENTKIRKFENDVAPEATVITGRFDRIEELPDGTLRIIDWKTGGVRSQAEADQDLQLSLYALAAQKMFKREVSELVLLFLVDEEVFAMVTRRSSGELQTAATTIRLLAESIASGDFTPTPSIATCRKCPYRRVCDASASR